MAHTQTISLYDQLIALIRRASSLSDTRKEHYITEIEKNGLSVGLKAELKELCEREAALIEEEVATKKAQRDHLQSVQAEEDASHGSDYDALVAENAKAMHTISTDYQAECGHIETSLDQSMETTQRSTEATQIHDLKKKLGL